MEDAIISNVVGVVDKVITVFRKYKHETAAVVAVLKKLNHQLIFFKKNGFYSSLSNSHSTVVQFWANQFSSDLQEITKYLQIQYDVVLSLSEEKFKRTYAANDLEAMTRYLQERLTSLRESGSMLVEQYEKTRHHQRLQESAVEEESQNNLDQYDYIPGGNKKLSDDRPQVAKAKFEITSLQIPKSQTPQTPQLNAWDQALMDELKITAEPTNEH